MARHRMMKYMDEDIGDDDDDDLDVTGTSVDEGILSTSMQQYLKGGSQQMSLQALIETQRTPTVNSPKARSGASGVQDDDFRLAELMKVTEITPRSSQTTRTTYGKGYVVDASVFGDNGPPPSPTTTRPTPSNEVKVKPSKQLTPVSGLTDSSVSSTASSPAPPSCPGTPTRERSGKTLVSRGSMERNKNPKNTAELENILNTRNGGKHLLNLVVVGHVDAGKSTLMGHVLFQLGFIDKKTMHRNKTDSEKLGKSSFAFAWVFDETHEERNRGVTIDVGHMRFETKNRIFNLMDAPGHRDFVPNMITGASQADVAILVVNATKGEFESGFDLGGQTREHALLLRALGVTQIVVAVNKMDTVGWAEERFKEISAKLRSFLKSTGFKDTEVYYIPVSGLLGLNLATFAKDIPKLTEWYNGPCLVDKIDALVPPDRGSFSLPTRFCVVDVFKGASGSTATTLAGIVCSGHLQVNDRLLLQPSSQIAQIKAITIDNETVPAAFGGDQAQIVLSQQIDPINIPIGTVLSDASLPAPTSNRFRARIAVFDVRFPLTMGFPVVLHIHNSEEPAHISKLLAEVSKTTGEVKKAKIKCLGKHSNGLVEIVTAQPIVVDLYKECKDLGRFLLRSGSATLAAGIVVEIGNHQLSL